ncbi:MAG: hypothetical protein COU47_02830 [Candidatus Niyogibacteria bacterium CG10_big_fil_rev_8_21_14_0_10_46_36]|uniref:POTRA domain-containing protein n=1 Tax=Candidatus Niyogibacteria bacterium CG10_big_fil_rev_8_21_14_0_10_46_36 TaxID=1974726 RepID=A0A2H0TF94_9BACT|nr:MAG: hypothetical protein COU47_02830 [Candidatus Niyogibacteria bacterium CG10_big_fil_rev_8_21_14_0_10_46_36]
MRKDPLRRSRRLKRNRFFGRLVFVSGGIFVFGALIVGFFHIPYFSIADISTEGVRTLPEENIQHAIRAHLQEKTWGILPHKNFFVFLLTVPRLEQTLMQEFPKIESLTIKKRPPHAVAISFAERSIWATLCKASSCFYLDKGGFVFGKSSRISGSLFFAIEDMRDTNYDVGAYIIAPEKLQSIQTLLERIETVSGASFETLTLSGSDDLIAKYEAVTKDGWSIIFDSKTDTGIAIQNFISAYDGLLKQDLAGLEYIDLRLENKIFYKYRD